MKQFKKLKKQYTSKFNQEKAKQESLVNIIEFNSAYEQPVNNWNVGKQLINWGSNNLYPDYLLNLYNYYGSPTHKMIIDKKVRLLIGQGFKDIMDQNLLQFVEDQDLEEEIDKVALDYEIFNGFAFAITWSEDKQSVARIKYFPISQLRFGLKMDDQIFDYFWYSGDWANTNKFKPEAFMEFNDVVREGTQIFYYSTPNPKNLLVPYPIPVYSTSFDAIETDYEIGKFNLNDVKQGFNPSFMINFPTGEPTEEERRQNDNRFIDSYGGNSNTSKAILTYSEDKDSAPVITTINGNNTDKRFLELADKTENAIVKGSGIPPQIVILTPGKLGSSEERAELKVEFQQDYISPRQKKLNKVLNKLLSYNGYTEKLMLKTYLDGEITQTTVQPVQ